MQVHLTLVNLLRVGISVSRALRTCPSESGTYRILGDHNHISLTHTHPQAFYLNTMSLERDATSSTLDKLSSALRALELVSSRVFLY